MGSVTLGNKIMHNRGYSGLGNNNSNMGSHRINTQTNIDNSSNSSNNMKNYTNRF